MAIVKKEVNINDVVLGKLTEQANAGRETPLTDDEVLQGRIDAEAAKVTREELNRAFRSLSQDDQIAALTAVNANPLAGE